jgi:hypothetical protein
MTMRAALALLLLAYLASSAHADPFDDQCKFVLSRAATHLNRPTPSWLYDVLICSDPEFRALTRERSEATAETNARLDPFAQQALMGEEARWGVDSDTEACGIALDAPLPLAPEIKNCMVRAMKARIAYIRAYSAPAVPGPSFDERIASLQPGQTTVRQAIARFWGTRVTPRRSLKGKRWTTPDGSPRRMGEIVVWVIGTKGVGVFFGHDGKMISVNVVTPTRR